MRWNNQKKKKQIAIGRWPRQWKWAVSPAATATINQLAGPVFLFISQSSCWFRPLRLHHFLLFVVLFFVVVWMLLLLLLLLLACLSFRRLQVLLEASLSVDTRRRYRREFSPLTKKQTTKQTNKNNWRSRDTISFETHFQPVEPVKTRVKSQWNQEIPRKIKSYPVKSSKTQ